MKGIIKGVGIFLLIASLIALLVLYHCLSRIKKGEEQETAPLPGNGSNEPWEILSQGQAMAEGLFQIIPQPG